MGQMKARYLDLSNFVTNSQLGGANLEYDSQKNIMGIGMLEDEEEIRAIEHMINEIWRDFDDDNNGYLDFAETYKFTMDFMDQLGDQG